MVGKRMFIYATSGGKSILTHLPENDRETFLERNKLKAYEHTITDPDALRDEFRTIQQTDYSVNDQEVYRRVAGGFRYRYRTEMWSAR